MLFPIGEPLAQTLFRRTSEQQNYIINQVANESHQIVGSSKLSSWYRRHSSQSS